MNEQEIHKICNELDIKFYTINQDGSIDVLGNVSIVKYKLNDIPIKFNKVSGYFYCGGMNLTSLNNCPIEVSPTIVPIISFSRIIYRAVV